MSFFEAVVTDVFARGKAGVTRLLMRLIKRCSPNCLCKMPGTSLRYQSAQHPGGVVDQPVWLNMDGSVFPGLM